MTKKELAEQLRQRQLNKKLLTQKLLELMDHMSDDTVIGSYITCHGCGHKQVDDQKLDQIISDSHCAKDFFDRCNDASESHKYSH